MDGCELGNVFFLWVKKKEHHLHTIFGIWLSMLNLQITFRSVDSVSFCLVEPGTRWNPPFFVGPRFQHHKNSRWSKLPLQSSLLCSFWHNVTWRRTVRHFSTVMMGLNLLLFDLSNKNAINWRYNQHYDIWACQKMGYLPHFYAQKNDISRIWWLWDHIGWILLASWSWTMRQCLLPVLWISELKLGWF